MKRALGNTTYKGGFVPGKNYIMEGNTVLSR
jgi:hypothetical protein